MNKVFKKVWNASRGAYVAVAETASSHGKSAGVVSAVAAGVLLASPLQALAITASTLPNGGQVTAGSASISTSGNTLTVNQSTQRSAINWQSFSIGTNGTVNFVQPNASSVTLNRVVGNEQSVIAGALNANGQVFLLNSSGILFTSGAQVNVGGIVASTLGMSDTNFMAGNTTFESNGANSSVINLGNIHAADGGYVALLGNHVNNQGVISAHLGTAVLAAGDKVSLNFNGDSLLGVTIDQGTLNALVENKQAIYADGGRVYLTTQALDSVLNGAVNNTGLIQANSVGTGQNGEVILYAHGGTVNVGGSIQAAGGFVETSGKEFAIQPTATVKAANWLIDPTDITIDSTLATALVNQLQNGGNAMVIDQSGTGSDLGNITINAPIAWTSGNSLTLNAANNIYINANITASGSAAGVALLYGQGAVANGNTSNYSIARGTTVNLTSGQHFMTKQGSDGAQVIYTVVNSASDMQNINNTLSGNFALGSSLNFAGVNWTPIGTFTGNFAGLGHEISNLTVTSASSAGLFGITNGALVRDIGVINANVTATNYADGVGLLIGTASATNIINAHTSGSVTANTMINGAGGLVGYLTNSSIKDSNSTINLIGGGASSAGGLVGYSQDSTIRTSYAAGSVSNAWNAGGLIGQAYVTPSGAGTVENTYSVTSVTAKSFGVAGGLIGSVFGPGAVSNSYASGMVTGANGSTNGGAVGSISGAPTMSNIYWDTTTTGQATSADLSSLTSTTGAITNANAYSQTTYSGFDLSNIWFSVDGYTRPFLRMEWTTNVSNAHELQMMSMKLGSTNVISYKLANSIDLAPTLTNISEMWKDTTGGSTYQGSFVPVGKGLVNRPTNNFYGSFDGQNHTIDHFYSYKPNTYGGGANSFVGLFGEVNGGTFKDLTFANADITGFNAVGVLMGSIFQNASISNVTINNARVRGHSQVGGLVGQDGYGSTLNTVTVSNVDIVATGDTAGGIEGYSSAANLQNSSASGTVSASGGLAGGLIGDMESSGALISNSHSSVTVISSGGDYVGGLVGALDDGAQINNSYATGNVTGVNWVGGLVGGQIWPTFTSSGSAISITNSHATGTVTGDNYVGGLVGAIDQSNSSIASSYSTGNVTGTANAVYVGGFIGSNLGSVSESYATGTVDGSATTSAGVGGFAGQNVGTISKSYATGNVDGGTNSNVHAGGFVGNNHGAIDNSYATGSVTGNVIGGFLGNNHSGDQITNSYATGNLIAAGTSPTAGGFAGFMDAADAINDFWNTTTSGHTVSHYDSNTLNPVSGSSGQIVGKTTAEMKMLATFSGTSPAWDIVVDPSISNVYPQLRWATNGLSAGSSVWVIGAVAPVAPPVTPPVTPPGNSAGGGSGPTSPSSAIDNAVANAVTSPTTLVPPSFVSGLPPQSGSATTPPPNVVSPPPVVVTALGRDVPLMLVTAPAAGQPTQGVTLSQARAMLNADGGAAGEGAKVVRVPTSRNSLEDIVNGGLNLPEGVEQELFVIAATTDQ